MYICNFDERRLPREIFTCISALANLAMFDISITSDYNIINSRKSYINNQIIYSRCFLAICQIKKSAVSSLIDIQKPSVKIIDIHRKTDSRTRRSVLIYIWSNLGLHRCTVRYVS